MSIPGSASPLFLTSAAAAAAPASLQIDRSLRFNSGDTAYLTRTPSSAGNRKTFTFSCWVKRSGLTAENNIFHAGNASWFRFEGTDELYVWHDGSTSVYTSAKFRDPTGWQHLVLAVDTTQSTASNRIKLYINGAQQTLSGTQPGPSADLAWNNNVEHYIGRQHHNTSNMLNGYLAEVNFIDGTQLAATDFGAEDSNGVWQPKDASGLTFGTNGFKLNFSDNTSTTTVAEDSSGNNNDFTAYNFSVASGAGNDSLIDTPTNYTAGSGNNGGNYCTMNPLLHVRLATLSNGNLDVTGGSYTDNGYGTIAVPSGKWYAEATVTGGGGASNIMLGVKDVGQTGSTDFGAVSRGYGYRNDAKRINSDNIDATYGATYTNGDTIGIALDLDAGTITFYKNGSSQGQAYSGISSSYSYHFCSFTRTTSDKVAWNFGQRPFAISSVPTGHLSVCTQNLPDPTIADGSTVFDVNLWSGDNADPRSRTLSFSPDLVWIKTRNQTNWNYLTDSVRGAPNKLYTNEDAAEDTAPIYGQIDSLNSDGFTLGGGTDSSNPLSDSNQTGTNYVAWAWDAGTSTVSNTDGSITSSVRANASSGCSIVSVTTSSSGGSIGHGLNASPGMLILKNRDSAGTIWAVWHSSLGTNDYLILNSNAAKTSDATLFNGTSNSTFTTGGGFGSANYICYCFAPVEGYSKFGEYDATQPFVYLGFTPRWLLLKDIDVAEDWCLYDSKREPINPNDARLEPNTSDAEISASTIEIDFLSNGFKIKGAGSTINGHVIYAAFAEHPFKTARAR